ncbi:MAG: hypothetical protein OXI25_01890 [Chloroflexota bacterium]|nr:hypothetical protein [Chloroflexota bacterium]
MLSFIIDLTAKTLEAEARAAASAEVALPQPASSAQRKVIALPKRVDRETGPLPKAA